MMHSGASRRHGPRAVRAIRAHTRSYLLPLLLACAAGTPCMLGAQTRPERFAEWTAPVFPADEYRARRSAVLGQLRANEILLVPSGEGTSGGETFRQLDDFEYLAGLEIPRSILALDGQSRRVLLFAPRMDPRFDNRGRPNDFPGRPLADDPALVALSGLDAMHPDSALDTFLRDAATRGMRVLVNSGRIEGAIPPSLSRFGAPSPGERLALELQHSYPGLALDNAYRQLATVRMVKSPREVALMREAARVTMVAIARGAARVRPGVDERTLTGAFSADCMALGAQRDAFTPIIKSGVNSLWPWRILGAHYDRRNRALRHGELVIYDVGCERDHYVSDVGRTFPVGGRFTPRQRELVEMIRKVSDAVIAAARPGITLAELQSVALAAIPESARPFMQAPLYFGHHLGLDTSDPSLPDAVLAPGMIFTIEPWYYNHVEGVAAFLEDEILITSAGSENLTAALPRDAGGLERLRAGQDSARQ